MTTSEHWDDEFIIHNRNSKCLLMLYFMQILTEGEAHTISITGDNSSGKTKNELTEHNGRCAWGKNQAGNKNPVRTLSGKEREKKGR